MQAAMLNGQRDLRVETIPRPTREPDQALLRVRQVGICGSDVHYFLHGRCGPFVPSRPFVLGHEFVATVAEIGLEFESASVGQRVVVNPAYSCGRCEACVSGRSNLCAHVVMLGSGSTTPPTNGALAEYVTVASHQCYVVPDSMDDTTAALMEPLSVALHAISRAGGVGGARVLITGGGTIGLMTAVAARILGAATVVVSEPSAARRLIVESVGVDLTLDPASKEFEELGWEVSDGGFDRIFEASGVASAVSTAMNLIRRGGTLVQIGTVSNNYVQLPLNDLMLREIAVIGTFRYADEFPLAIRLAASGRLKQLAALVSVGYTLAEVQSAMTLAAAGKDGFKVHVSLD